MRNLTLLAIACLIGLLSQAQTTKRVLFIGNSYTGVNNLPQMVFQAAESVGDELVYDSHTPGGARLMNHAANPTAINKISGGTWDHVVLQAQSQEPSWSQAQLQSEVFPYAKILCDTIRHFDSNTEPLFYMTWGRKNGDAMNCQYAPWVCTYHGMDSALRASYLNMANMSHSEVSPVGPVWRYIRNHYPAIELYTSDESHPSLAGSYAAAVTFYTVIFDKDPEHITWNSTLSSSVADSIKAAAKRIAFDSLSYWDRTQNTPTPTADFSFSVNSNTVQFTSITGQNDSLRWNFDDGNSSTQLNPSHTYLSTGTYQVELKVWLNGNHAQMVKNVQIDSVTSLENIEEQRFVFYPIPAKDKLTVKMHKQEKTLVQIYTKTGRLIYQQTHYNQLFEIDLSNFVSGVYIINFSNDRMNKSEKFIKIE